MSKLALVTGSSSGIGQAIALQLAQDGYTILAHYNSNHDKAETLLRELRKIQPESLLVQFDVNQPDEIERALKNYPIEVLINNAGIHLDQFTVLMNNENFEKVVKTNLFGPFYISKLCAKKMLSQKKGCIVNISSIAGQVGNVGQGNYAASKAGLVALTKTMAMELGPRGIRVNAVAPGLIDSEMIKSIPEVESFKGRIPLGRFGKPEEIAKVVSFLCSDSASYITGHTLSVNGGLYSS